MGRSASSQTRSAPRPVSSPVGGLHIAVGGATPPERRAAGWITRLGRAVAPVASVFVWETHSQLRRPATYLLLLASTLCAAWSFSWLVTLLARGGGIAFRQVDDPIVQFMGPNVFLVGWCTLLVPWLTMNAIAEERRRGTWELLLTAPVTAGHVVTGKFLACWIMMLASLAAWPAFLLVLRVWNGESRMILGIVPWIAGPGIDFDPGPLAGGVAGLAVLAATFTSLGVLCSSVFRRPVAAALAALGLMGVALVLAVLPRVFTFWGLPAEQTVWVAYVSPWAHLERFSRGTLAPRVGVAHLAVTSVCLWLATRASLRNDDG